MKKSKVIFFLALIGINLCAKYFFELQLTFRQVLTIHIFLFLLFFLTSYSSFGMQFEQMKKNGSKFDIL